jgi:hypothetical protein
VDERGLVPDAAALLRHQDLEVVDHSLLHSIATTLIRLIWFLLTVIESIIGLRCCSVPGR